jgi:protein CpxP
MSIIQQSKLRQRFALLSLVCAAGAAMGAAGADGPQDAAGPPRADFHQRPQGCGPDGHLSEDQQDKVFAILHAAAPQLREHMKAARKARDALRDLSESSDYDNGKATTLAQAQASAESQLTLLRTRTDHDIYLVLTQEQRTQVAQRQRERHAHEGAPPPP